MRTGAQGQYDIVLENRQITIIFFAVVVLCAVFFALGYIVGKNTTGYIGPAGAGVTPVPGESSALAPAGAADPTKVQAASALPASELNFQQTLEKKGSPARLQTPVEHSSRCCSYDRAGCPPPGGCPQQETGRRSAAQPVDGQGVLGGSGHLPSRPPVSRAGGSVHFRQRGRAGEAAFATGRLQDHHEEMMAPR